MLGDGGGYLHLSTYERYIMARSASDVLFPGARIGDDGSKAKHRPARVCLSGPPFQHCQVRLRKSACSQCDIGSDQLFLAWSQELLTRELAPGWTTT